METSGTFRDYFSQGSSSFSKALIAGYPRDLSGVSSTIGLLFISRKLLMVIGDEKLCTLLILRRSGSSLKPDL